ncbi:MAG: long-chain fatty acid--CoA ligase [Clostridia bacterium]|nr:long-chain fatty acid--CoA ligase [Clostridia bacterium]
MIVLKNGKKVFPDELETVINRLDEVLECIVYGIPDKKDKNDIKLSVKVVYDKDVVQEKYPNITPEELETVIWQKIKEINKTFPPYKYIKNMILTDKELIKTTTKKVKRNEEIKNLLEN